MPENPLRKLEAFGQSIWMDFIRRGSIDSGELLRYIQNDGVTGVTSNPSIFEKAIAGSHDYDESIRSLALEGKNVAEIFRALSVEDIQRAADLFRPIYDRTGGRDGFVSIEVSPGLALETEKTMAEARELWKAVNRPNIMVKVPGTKAGLPAIRQLISEGININITLLFGLPRYKEVAEAYITGLEDRAAKGQPVKGIASVASFFLSRIDVLVDPMLEKIEAEGGQRAEIARKLQGQVAIASAKVAYQMYKETFKSTGDSGSRYRRLETQGALPQRLLWASTSTKNPAYADVMYVEALIGPETVDTLPVETLEAYRDHGKPEPLLEKNVDQAHRALEQLGELGIDIDKVTQQLEDEGVQKFVKSFDLLEKSIQKSREAALKEPVDPQNFKLGRFQSDFQNSVAALDKDHFAERLWKKDPTLWKKDPKAQEQIRGALGWLHVAEKIEECLEVLEEFAKEVQSAGFKHVLHMGMGGSSLAPLVFQETFQTGSGGLALTVLDTTDPAKIQEIERSLPLRDTVFIVASKSGTTAEPEAFMRYFYDKVKALKGDKAGENFIAITDPGTPLVKQAREMGFRKVFLNYADIGGRYSALSYFGMVPAALMGMDAGELLVRALRMAHACEPCVPADKNPGLMLGAAMGTLARQGAYQVTFQMPPALASFGMWLEQLLAESTGKEDRGLLPVAGEPLGDPSSYGKDRLFVFFQLQDEKDGELERTAEALQKAGQPVITIQMHDRMDLGQEFFRWEIATVTAGAILEINPLDQPNVQESKDNTNRLLDDVRKSGNLPEPTPTLAEGPLRFYAEPSAKGGDAASLLKDFFAQAKPGDYVALQAYIQETPQSEKALQDIRARLRDSLHIATTIGYGPRFLHSTGQFHKGGPNTGLFLQIIDEETAKVPIPGAPYTFGTFIHAQALGDLQALRKHDRRAISVNIGPDVSKGLEVLNRLIEQALAGVKA